MCIVYVPVGKESIETMSAPPKYEIQGQKPKVITISETVSKQGKPPLGKVGFKTDTISLDLNGVSHVSLLIAK